jgi:hypothetical protein
VKGELRFATETLLGWTKVAGRIKEREGRTMQKKKVRMRENQREGKRVKGRRRKRERVRKVEGKIIFQR